MNEPFQKPSLALSEWEPKNGDKLTFQT